MGLGARKWGDRMASSDHGYKKAPPKGGASGRLYRKRLFFGDDFEFDGSFYIAVQFYRSFVLTDGLYRIEYDDLAIYRIPFFGEGFGDVG